MASPIFEQFFSAHALAAARKQRNLDRLISPVGFDLDLPGGQILFSGIGFNVEVLGSESAVDGSWLWGWGNEHASIPAHVVTRSSTLPQAAGGKIQELSTRTFPTAVATGERLAVVAGGILGADGYYQCLFDGGQLFVLLFDPRLSVRFAPSVHAVETTLLQALDLYEIVDQRLAVQAFARTCGIAVTEQGQALHLVGSDGAAVAEFDNGMFQRFTAEGPA